MADYGQQRGKQLTKGATLAFVPTVEAGEGVGERTRARGGL